MDTKKLRQKILDLAIHGKLVPQDPNDEPASVLLERIKKEKEQLIKQGKIKAPKKSKTPSDTSHYPKDVPFAIPKGWGWCHIQDIATSELGKTLDRVKNTGEEKPYLCALNVKWGSFDLSTIKTIRIEEKEKARYQLQPSDLLVCEGGDVGRSAIWEYDSEMYYQNALHRVRFFDKISPKFYLHILSYYKNNGIIDEMCKGVTIKHFTSQVFSSLALPLPPIKEQYRIVKSIDKWFYEIDGVDSDCNDLKERIQKAKSKILDLAIQGKLVPQDPNDEPAIELLKRINPDFKPSDNLHYFESLANGWCCVTFGDVADYINGRAFKPEEWEKKGLPIVRIQNLNDQIASYNYTTHRYEKRYFIKNGDILFAWAASLDAYIWNKGNAWLNQHIFHVIPKAFVLPKYLYYTLKAKINDFYQRSHGSGMVHITRNTFLKELFFLPPVKEQQRIVSKIEELFSLLEDFENSCK